jgi:membrane fusion protein (multidrug efflux system)
MKTRTRRWLITIVGLLLVVGVLAGVKAGQIVTMVKAGASFAPPPESVATAKVQQLKWQGSRSAIGSLVAVRAVTLGAELTGKVQQISFESGTSVRKGAVLVRLDTSAEEAQLAAARADAALARATLERAKSLRAGEANSVADLDAAKARAQQTEAAVANLEATLAKKTIRAPFDGRIAIRQVELGQILSPGTPIASLQSVSPIHAEFSLPQQALAELKEGQRVHIQTDAFPGATWNGEITTINPEVDVATRNVRVRATFPNPDGRLRPGMFAKVDIVSSDQRQVLAIPATAALYAPYGDSVYVLEEKKGDGKGPPATVARQKFVRLGERRGDFVEVLSGLSAGETVVSAGAFKLRNGVAVAVNQALAPDAQIAPKPANP